MTTGQEYLKFDDESALEEFVASSLDRLWGMRLISRQYRVNGEICDILAVDRDRALTIIELKNNEDRYIIQQLTRYYHSLKLEQPFSQDIDYDRQIRLIAMSPVFHKHNLIDREYSKLNIEFVRFDVVKSKGTQSLRLFNLESKLIDELVLDDTLPLTKKVNDADLEAQQLIDYYVRVKYAQSLGIRELSIQERLDNFYRKGKPSKLFKIRLNPPHRTDNYKYVSVKVPSKITIGQFMYWVIEHVPQASAILTSSGKSYLLNNPRK